MATNSNPSFFAISSAEFDGTTPLTADWSPNASPRSQPRSYASPSLTGVGRISYAKFGQPGSKGMLVIARTWSSTAVLTLTVRSESAAENTAGNNDTPVPNNLDSALLTRALTTDWCAPFLMGPTDAIAIDDGSLVAVPATVEIMTVDLGDDSAVAYLNALFAQIAANPTVAVRIVTVTEVIPAFSGTQYILANAAAVSMNLTLPLASSVVAGTTLVVTRTGGGWFAVLPQGADTINGSTNSIIMEDIGQVTFTLRGGVWLASEAPITTDLTATNAVADNTVALPAATGTTLVNVTFTARGILSLPATANVALGVEYLIQRVTDNAGFSPSRVRINTQAVGDTLNGLANGFAILGNPGAVIRLRRVPGGWVEVSDRQSTPMQVITATVDSTLDSGWIGLKAILGTQVAAQVLTLPAAALVNPGCEFIITYPIAAPALGAGSLTINAGVVNIIGGGFINTAATLGYNETATLVFDGTQWLMVRSAPTVRSLTEAVDRVMVERWNGLRIFRCTQAGAQTMTLPSPLTCPIGMEAQFVCLGAGGLTVNGGAANSIVSAGALAATKAIATNTCMRLVCDGTTWAATI